MTAVPLVVVAAVARNSVIGGGNQLLWRLPSDMKHFRALTMGRPMIMGRKTFASIGKALPGRETIVVTRERSFTAAGVHAAHDIAAAQSLGQSRALAMGAPEVVLAGGAELYAAMLGQAARLHITEVDLAPEGDAVFPPIDPARWREVARRFPIRAPGDEAAFCFVEYARR